MCRTPAAKADIGIGGEVDNEVRALHRWGNLGGMQQVAAHRAEVRMRQRAVQELRLAGREIVEADDDVPRC
jgi:hypothetical protein